MKSIFKTKLQIIPVLIIIALGVLILVNKFFLEYPSGVLGGIIWGSFLWLIGIIICILACFTGSSFLIKLYNRKSEYLFEKRTLLIILELLIIFVFLYSSRESVHELFRLSDDRINQIMQNKNRAVIENGVSKLDSDAISALFLNGNPMERKSKVLRISRINASCVSNEGKNYSRFKECRNDDVVVEYGYDVCFPDSFDCVGEKNKEYYHLRNMDSKWNILEKKSY